jgi:hypothetical protein
VVLNVSVVLQCKDILRKIINDTLTGPDNITYDYAKVAGFSAIWVFFACMLWHLYDDNVFDPITFASAFSAILVSTCGGVWLKNKGGDNTPPAPSSSTSSITKIETVESKNT